MSRSRFRCYAAAVLLLQIAVILWGAFVRASGSGAGCGQHWPLCNGVAIPHSPALATVIEFTHRISSGVALLSVVILAVLAMRSFPKKHLARRAAMAALIFELMEAVIGAGLVLLGHTARNPSTARGYSLSVHLVNTLLLLAAVTVCVWAATDHGYAWREKWRAWAWPFGLATGGLLLLCVSGTIAALGDTLFRSTSLSEGFRQDFVSNAHPFVRLRVWHPVIAAFVSVALAALSTAVIRRRVSPGAVRAAWILAGLLIAQLGAGMINLALLAPVPLQIVHLLLADCVWIALVVLGAELAGHRLDEGSHDGSDRPLSQKTLPLSNANPVLAGTR